MQNKIDDILKLNFKNKKIFSEYEIIDWYDGAIFGIGRLANTDDYYLFQMVAYNLKIPQRVYVLLKIDATWKNEFKLERAKVEGRMKINIIKKMVVSLYSNYTDSIYLLKAKSIEEKIFEIKKVVVNNLIYYSNIDKVINQSKKQEKKWFDFFNT
jgi:hypothetical protein